MNKLAIVSSYSDSCGNAAFTKVLHDSIENATGAEVDVLELDLKLLQSSNPLIRKKADVHIAALAEQLREYDLVNIQLEAGLYGTMPGDIINRTKKLFQANRNTTITFHSPRLMEATSAGTRAALKQIASFKIKSGLKELIGSKFKNVHIRINRAMLKNAIANQARIIVHTNRAARQIEQLFDYGNVSVHPLKIVPTDFQPDTSVLQRVREQLSLEATDKLVGMFGYISAYKGHTDALKAMRFLPKNYKLLIFGRQHPQTLKSDGKMDVYLNELITTVSKDKILKDRVFFMGELNDDDFLQMAAGIDIAWLPYYENGQDGSGIASICLDACRRTLCSSSFAFDELFKLIPYNNYLRFDIGNFLEMASKTEMLMRREPPVGGNVVSHYSLATQAAVYIEEIAMVEQMPNQAAIKATQRT
ncbi:hypothetical protein LH464_08965 [Neorhizobium sp. T786]|uniref:glycosyltransferase n=1 Tax=Pseudorhizobium xiangyangii TaxID=2883104 RepID=UPI001CFFEE49|nr:glycosyltransferase [Neorhizobium xiangyangii]MCB5202608.1 hypothetical protein [Neorhizobium xiangyangii]